MITPDFEQDNLREHGKVFDNAAVNAKRCIKCGKIYFVNIGSQEKYVCHHCRELEMIPLAKPLFFFLI